MKTTIFAFIFFCSSILILSGCEVAKPTSTVPDNPWSYGRPDPVQGQEPVTQAQDVNVSSVGYGANANTDNAIQPNYVPSGQQQYSSQVIQQPLTQQQTGHVAKIAILLPLSGQHAGIGNAMLQAAQQALFDMGEGHIELLPKDTKGTAQGGAEAAEQAVQDNVQLVVGPLFAKAVSGAKPVANRAGLSLIAFSTDRTVAGQGSFLMGVLPQTQAERMADYANRIGLKRIGVVTSNDAYGQITAQAFELRASMRGVQMLSPVVLGGASSQLDTLLNSQVQAVFLPLGGSQLRQTVKTIRQARPDMILLGTGLWDDDALLFDHTMEGAYYAAPEPRLRQGFVRNYESIYGEEPPRIASIAYDATALSIVLARNATAAVKTASTSTRYGLIQPQKMGFSTRDITNPNGFSGIDGIFRFRADGLVERGLAVIQIKHGRHTVVDAAPVSFIRR